MVELTYRGYSVVCHVCNINKPFKEFSNRQQINYHSLTYNRKYATHRVAIGVLIGGMLTLLIKSILSKWSLEEGDCDLHELHEHLCH